MFFRKNLLLWMRILRLAVGLILTLAGLFNISNPVLGYTLIASGRRPSAALLKFLKMHPGANRIRVAALTLRLATDGLPLLCTTILNGEKTHCLAGSTAKLFQLAVQTPREGVESTEMLGSGISSKLGTSG